MSSMYEPRIVAIPVMKKSGDLGVRLVGGNAVGIFIHSVEIDSVSYQVSLVLFPRPVELVHFARLIELKLDSNLVHF